MSYLPTIFQWDGEAMIPASPRFAKQCDAQFVVGEKYILDVNEDRSSVSHRHLFLEIRRAWGTLPERMASQFPTAEKLRKWALIRVGHRDERSIVASSKAEALRMAAFIGSMDEYAEVSVSGSMVVVFTAKSISRRALDKQGFQVVKQKVIDLLDDLLGTERGTVARQGEEAA